MPGPLVAALADAGLFQLALPRALGGAEIDLPTYVQMLEEIGKADASTGWVVNQCAIFATYAARIPRDIARLIWLEHAGPDGPGGRGARRVPGYRPPGVQLGLSTCRLVSGASLYL